MPAFAVIYRYTDDTTARDAHRPDHRAFLKRVYEEQKIIFSGPMNENGAPSALLMMRGESVEEIASLLDSDPFNTAGLIKKREIRPFEVVFGWLPDPQS